MRIPNFLQKFFGKREVHISSDSLTDYNINQAILSENAELKAIIDKKELELAKYKQTPKKQEREEKIKFELNKKKDELQEIKKFNYFSFGELFRALIRNPKLSGKTFLTDFERGEKLDKFVDFGIAEDGTFVTIGKEGVVWGARDLKDVFWNVKGLKNDFNSGLVPLCIDSDGNHIENLMTYDIPEIQRFGTKLQYTKARKRPVYEIVSEKNKIIQEQSREIEENEELIAELHQKVDTLERGIKVKESSNANLISEISENNQAGKNIDRNFQSLIRRLEFAETKNMIVEAELEKLEAQVEKLLEEAEVQGAKTNFEKVLETMQHIRREYSRDQPEIRVIESPSNIQNIEEIGKK